MWILILECKGLKFTLLLFIFPSQFSQNKHMTLTHPVMIQNCFLRVWSVQTKNGINYSTNAPKFSESKHLPDYPGLYLKPKVF